MTSGRIPDATSFDVTLSAKRALVVVVSPTWKRTPARTGRETSASTSHSRRLPASWRTVRTKIAATSALALRQVLEDALERVVERLDPREPDGLRLGDPWQ